MHLQIPITDRANGDGEGIFLRNDGKEIPQDILKETRDFLWSVHNEANKFAKVKEIREAPQSIGKSISILCLNLKKHYSKSTMTLSSRNFQNVKLRLDFVEI